MIISNKYSPYIKRKIDLFFATLLVLLIAFSSFSDFALTSDIESEKIENFADGESENKDKENSEKDCLPSTSNTIKLDSNINGQYSNTDQTKLNNSYLKIPTPPPDLV